MINWFNELNEFNIDIQTNLLRNTLEVETKITACMDDVIVAITNIVINTTMALSVKFSISR